MTDMTDMNAVLTYVSHSHRKLGYDPSELIGKPGHLYVHEKDIPYLSEALSPFYDLKHISEVTEAGEEIPEITMDYRVFDAWGNLHHIESIINLIIDTNGEDHQVVNISRDVTERKQAEKALQESEEQFRTLVSNIPGIIYRAACDKHRTMYLITSAIHDICGYPAADFIKNRVRNFASIIHPDDREMVDQAVQWAISRKEPFMIEYRIIHADRSVRWVYEKGRGIFASDGLLEFLDGAIFDITKNKQVEDAITKAATLEELDKLRSALLASVSHELRTPLTSIKGLASTLIQPDIEWDKETQMDFLQTINREADRLTHIVSDLVDMSQLEAGIMRMTPKDISIHSLFKQLQDELLIQSGNHQLEINLPDDLPLIYSDDIRIGEVISNLVANAAAYSEENTQITVETRQADGNILITVTDQGIGIAVEHLEKVFNRFYRLEDGVKRRRGGTGLGLSICKGIVEAHNGRIWVESKPGEGASFSFSLPIEKKAVAIDSQKPNPMGHPPTPAPPRK
jgi:PAS domain S-box-containing protein